MSTCWLHSERDELHKQYLTGREMRAVTLKQIEQYKELVGSPPQFAEPYFAISTELFRNSGLEIFYGNFTALYSSSGSLGGSKLKAVKTALDSALSQALPHR